MATLTFTYTVEISDADAATIRKDQTVAEDGAVTARTYGTGLLGLIVSGHGLPAIYEQRDDRYPYAGTGVHQTTRGQHWSTSRTFEPLAASMVLED